MGMSRDGLYLWILLFRCNDVAGFEAATVSELTNSVVGNISISNNMVFADEVHWFKEDSSHFSSES